MGKRMGREQRIEHVARWWTQAAKEERFRLLQRLCGQKTPQKGDPTLAELKLAIVLAEAEAGEIIHEAGATR
jgi:hypothetical protein